MIAACAAAAVFVITAIYLTWWLSERPSRGRHAGPFAGTGEAPDTPRLRQIQGDRTTLVRGADGHHEPVRTDPFPATGPLPMLPPDPPAGDTAELPHAVGTWGKTVTQMLDDMEAEYSRQVTA